MSDPGYADRLTERSAKASFSGNPVLGILGAIGGLVEGVIKAVDAVKEAVEGAVKEQGDSSQREGGAPPLTGFFIDLQAPTAFMELPGKGRYHSVGVETVEAAALFMDSLKYLLHQTHDFVSEDLRAKDRARLLEGQARARQGIMELHAARSHFAHAILRMAAVTRSQSKVEALTTSLGELRAFRRERQKDGFPAVEEEMLLSLIHI